MLIVKELSWHILNQKAVKNVLFLIFKFFWPIEVQKAVQNDDRKKAVPRFGNFEFVFFSIYFAEIQTLIVPFFLEN